MRLDKKIRTFLVDLENNIKLSGFSDPDPDMVDKTLAKIMQAFLYEQPTTKRKSAK